MTRAFALFSVLAAAFTCYSQSVTVQPSTISGIEIIGPQAPDFAASVAQIVGTDQPGNLTAWLPYGVVVKNNSPQALAAMTVVWTETLDAGPLRPVQRDYWSWFNAPLKYVQPGSAVLAIPQNMLQQPRNLTAFSAGRGLGNLPNFQRAQRIEVALDGVVFASGQFAGADTYSAYEEYQAQIDVPRSVATTVLEKKATSPISDILAWLQLLSASRGGDFTAQRSGSMARQLLGVYSRKGEAALYSLAQSILQEPAFPLHR
jgi:hypothetical protein